MTQICTRKKNRKGETELYIRIPNSPLIVFTWGLRSVKVDCDWLTHTKSLGCFVSASIDEIEGLAKVSDCLEQFILHGMRLDDTMRAVQRERIERDLVERREKMESEKVTTEEKIEALRMVGYKAGDRDPRLNQAFAGKYMVTDQDYEDAELPTQDGRNGPWCIVGDDLGELVDTAFRNFCED